MNKLINTDNQIAKLQNESVVSGCNTLQIKNAGIVFRIETSGTWFTTSVNEFNTFKISHHISAVEKHTPVSNNNKLVIAFCIFAINQNVIANENDRFVIKQNEFDDAVDHFENNEIDFTTADNRFEISKNYFAGKHYEYANDLNVFAIKKEDFARDNNTHAGRKNGFVCENAGNQGIHFNTRLT